MSTTPAPRHGPSACALHQAMGDLESCVRDGCALWDERPGACALAGVQYVVREHPRLAAYLVALRRELEAHREAG